MLSQAVSHKANAFCSTHGGPCSCAPSAIADLTEAGAEQIAAPHIAGALKYRLRVDVG